MDTSTVHTPIITDELMEFCRRLPKVELHAHINGCIRATTLRELVHAKLGEGAAGKAGLTPQAAARGGNSTLSECFALFDVIHRVATDHETVERVTLEALEDFQSDGCCYAELRTTPKARAELGMTKESYLQAVLRGYDAFARQQSGVSGAMVARLILSIDRRETMAEAMETVQLAERAMAGGVVVGVDLSGNPTVGRWEQWHGALLAARRAGLKLSLHCAEVFNPAETLAMVQLPADRLGHMCCLDDRLRSALFESGTPVEVCLSSNVCTESVLSYADHHFMEFRTAGHPCCLCTDDTGVFSTSMSRELARAGSVHGLSRQDLFELSRGALQHAFLPKACAGEWARLRAAFAEFAAAELQQKGAN